MLVAASSTSAARAMGSMRPIALSPKNLREAKVPAQISLYLGATAATDETHLFHIPSNRLRAMRENLAWFDFWLRDRRDPELDDRGAFDRWSKMAKQWKPGCTRALGAERR
jgi:hypothetical protein